MTSPGRSKRGKGDQRTPMHVAYDFAGRRDKRDAERIAGFAGSQEPARAFLVSSREMEWFARLFHCHEMMHTCESRP